MCTTRTVPLLLGLLAVQGAFAQLPMVDVSAVEVPGELVEIRLRPDASFNGVLSSVVFTLEWPEAGGATLGDPLQDVPQVQYCYVGPSGAMHQEDGRRFQVYAGFGSVPLSNVGAAWQQGQEVVLCRVPVIGGPANIRISTHPWTVANNGSYYISLNGEDRTGAIYPEGAISINELLPESPMVIWPDVDQGLIHVRIEGRDGPMQLRVCDLQGKTVVWEPWVPSAGAGNYSIGVGPLPAGAYLVEAAQGVFRSVQRVVWMP